MTGSSDLGSAAVGERLWVVAETSLPQRVRQVALDHGLIYVFAWLAPLGIPGLQRCPRPWVTGAGVSAATVIAFGIYNAEPGVARSLFNVLGPLLSLGAGVTLLERLLRPGGASLS